MNLYVFSVWLHVIAATVWVGSMVFFALAVVPVLKRPEHSSGFAPLVRAVGARFRVIGWVCLAVLAVTGIANVFLHGFPLAYVASADFWESAFGRTLFHKLVLVALVVLATVLHDVLMGKRAVDALHRDPNSPAALRSRKIASVLGRVTLLLSLGILAFAVALARGVPW